MTSKERTNPIGNSGEVFNKKTDNRTKKNQKHLKYTLLFLFGVILGILFGAIFKLC